MKYFKSLFLISALVLSAAASAEGMLTIMSPEDGAMLGSGSGDKLEYNITLSPSGNHIHVYIDDQRPIIVRNVSGCPCSMDLPDLSSGKHTIVMKEATSGHSLTGLEASVTVTVK